MSWMLWVVVAWIVFGIVVTVAVIGKERKPITPEAAAWAIGINLALLGLIIAGGHLS